jgi:hypothetical protein
MIKTINVWHVGLVSAGALLVLISVLSVTTNTAHAALVLDSTTTSMLANTLSAARNLMNTVQTDINVGAFTPAQSTTISASLGSIGNVLVSIDSIMGGIGLPNTGYPPDPGTTN